MKIILFLYFLRCFSAAAAPDPQQSNINVFVVPQRELIVIQFNYLNTQNLDVVLVDSCTKIIQKTTLYQGSTIAYFDTQTLYSGQYLIKISDGGNWFSRNITLTK